jgi:hypothetical protein
VQTEQTTHTASLTELGLPRYVPVYTMLPLDSVTSVNTLADPERLKGQLAALRAAGVDGVMADVWWGVVEAEGPGRYDWSAYKALMRCIESEGLKVQVVLSFHQCGGNVGDGCYIPLPRWVLECAEENEDMLFTNRRGRRNPEYLSFGVDDKPVLDGRTAIEVYADFMASFRREMTDFLDAGMITEVEVGLGPAGELRYPSYPETHGWRFPGMGEFQCYDKYLQADLAEAANAVGHPEWGLSGPHDAGTYNDHPEMPGFFRSNCGSYQSAYGRWFLTWYSSRLIRHGDEVLAAAAAVFEGCPTTLVGKVAGVHWWYDSAHHAAELTAGYYNTRDVNGYVPIAELFAEHGCALNFTCFEMRNSEQPDWARCNPEGLVNQVLEAAWSQGLDASCENALPRYDRGAFEKIMQNALRSTGGGDDEGLRRISSFTFLRLCPELLDEDNWHEYVRFVRAMHAGLDRQPEATAPTRRVQRTRELHEITLPTSWAAKTVFRASGGWGRTPSLLYRQPPLGSGAEASDVEVGEGGDAGAGADDDADTGAVPLDDVLGGSSSYTPDGLPSTTDSVVWSWRQRLALDRLARSARRVVRTAASRGQLEALSSRELWEYVATVGVPVESGTDAVSKDDLVDLVASLILQEVSQERSVAAAAAAFVVAPPDAAEQRAAALQKSLEERGSEMPVWEKTAFVASVLCGNDEGIDDSGGIQWGRWGLWGSVAVGFNSLFGWSDDDSSSSPSAPESKGDSKGGDSGGAPTTGSRGWSKVKKNADGSIEFIGGEEVETEDDAEYLDNGEQPAGT